MLCNQVRSSVLSRKYLYIVEFLLFLMVSVSAVVGQEPAAPTSTMSWLDYKRMCTWSIGVVQTEEHTNRKFFAVIGTGVVIALNEHTAYLVTAKHVFDDPSKNWHPNELRLRFAWQEDKSFFEELGVPLTVRDAKGNPLWKSLDDGSDIAAIQPPEGIKAKSAEAIFPDAFPTEDDLYQGAAVVVIGYPGIVGNEYLVRAIVRQGIVAWTNPTEPLNNVFMVDSNLYLGNSGGPVFRVPTGLTKTGSF